MEPYLPISYLNDFIFCPRSIYFHQLYGRVSKKMYHSSDQIKGLAAHKTVDEKRYTTSAHVLQSLEVYSDEYGLAGKIDTFDYKKCLLTERKKRIKMIYDGYIFQLYAQYFCLIEMGYKVNAIRLYSMDDNKVHVVKLPDNNPEMKEKFINLIAKIRAYSLTTHFNQNPKKCAHCIYRHLCDYDSSSTNQTT